jgi:hypothetical protein
MSLADSLSTAVLNLYGAVLDARSEANAWVRFPNAHAATSWAATSDVESRCRAMSNCRLDESTILVVDL